MAKDESGGKFPHLAIRWIRDKMRKSQTKEGKKEKKKKEGARKKGGEKKMKFFSAFQLSKLDDPRRKVDPRIESYTCVPKFWSFVKLYEIGNFPTLIISSLKVI